jgi:glycosyltransferase involved in cell wall biosynthesis
MVTACTTVDAGRVEEAHRLVASLSEHEPGASLFVLVLAREEEAAGADAGREGLLTVAPQHLRRDGLDLLAAAYPAPDLAQALAPAALRMLLVQTDHVVLLDRVARLTGPLTDVVEAVRAAGVLADADGRLIGLARGAAADALLDRWDAVVASRDGVDVPLPAGVARLAGTPPWEPVSENGELPESTGWERTWSGFRMDPAVRQVFRAGWRAGRLGRGPYDRSGEQALFEELAAPAAQGASAGVTRYMEAVYATDASVRERVGDPEGDGAAELVAWLRGAGSAALDPPPGALGSDPPTDPVPASAAAPDRPPLGVNLVGYLRAELGVAEVARQVIGALDAAQVPLLPIAISAGTSREGHAFEAVERFASPFAVDLLCVNADQTPHVAATAGPDFFAGRYTIGLWWWEVSDFPDYFRSAFEAVDEVWAGSAFVADTLRAVSPRPVVRMPMPVVLPEGVAPDRARFGFGDDVTFLFMFDYNSIVERKNPLGLIDAYRRAFPTADGTRLVLKCINQERHPEAHARVLEAMAGRDDLVIMDAYLPAADKDALLASCDCYVSLHRSEGFGLPCAEAMLLEKPVIATGYSGAADFMDPDHSLPVGWTMVPVGAGNEPYPADGEWADPDLDQAARHMRAVAADPELRRTLGARARAFVEREHSPEAAGAAMRARLELVAELAAPSAPVVSPSTALERVRATVDRGPAPGGGPRWHPRRLARALALRATSPRARHQRLIDRELLAAAEEAIAETAASAGAIAQRAEVEAWQATARSLRERRRVDAELGALRHRLSRLEAGG